MEEKNTLLNTTSADKWQRITARSRSGFLVPLFSVYSRNSLSMGDFSDLKLLIDWAKSSGNSIVQLLPMNELGPLFCPYDSFSSFALEPLYISLDFAAAGFKDEIARLKKDFPCGKMYVDYAFKKEKLSLLAKVYQGLSGEDSPAISEFRRKNDYWLKDFALFKALKDYHAGRPWWEWEERYKNRSAQDLVLFADEHAAQIDFQIWVQWLAFKQFQAAKEYAQAQGVFLKGDLPILVSRDSADVWAHPDFFKLEFASGAPPDMYCAKGQRWGMPTNNWENIAFDGYRYLQERVKYAENFYDILRIDHVVGLFRIWSIPYNDPLDNQGLNGSFDPQDEGRWKEQGKKILSVMLESTRMLLCAEDLGVIPPVCTQTLGELGIPGNDVQRWIKEWKIKHDFLPPEGYRYLAVAMLSTHDTTNWPGWWENEAGTIDEALFIRKCGERGINYAAVKERLFDLGLSRHGRLRWLDSVDSTDKLVDILNQGLPPKGTVPKEHLLDFIDLYENSYREKEKLWKQFKLSGPMREKCDSSIMRQALKVSLDARAIFCINNIFDWLYLGDIIRGDPYQYRVNTPGTITQENWSLTLPLSLEELLKHKVTKEIRKMIADAGRT